MVDARPAPRSLDPAATVAETLTGGRGDTVTIAGQARHVVGYMQDFLFAPEQARTPVAALSGGERGRLMLARALAKPSNLLVLDEPTNDLDLETLDLLEEMLDDYPGTVLLVSHDRDFLDRIVTSTIVAEGEGRWIVYAGGYSDMVAQRGEGVTRENAGAAVAIQRAPQLRQTSPSRRFASASSRSTRSMRSKPCRGESRRLNQTSRACRRPWPIPVCMRAIQPFSRRLRPPWRGRNGNSRRPRTAGLASNCCERNWGRKPAFNGRKKARRHNSGQTPVAPGPEHWTKPDRGIA